MTTCELIWCTYHNVYHPAEEFAISRSTPEGRQNICRAGHAELYQERYKRRYRCVVCGVECTADARSTKACRCAKHQEEYRLAYQRERSLARCKTHKLGPRVVVEQPAEVESGCDWRCDRWYECNTVTWIDDAPVVIAAGCEAAESG